MSRGRKTDYRVDKVKPQLNMPWPLAVQYMLQGGTVSNTDPNPYIGKIILRIRDGVLQYRYEAWSKWGAGDLGWGNAARISVSHKARWDAEEKPEISCPEEPELDPFEQMILARLEKLENKK